MRFSGLVSWRGMNTDNSFPASAVLAGHPGYVGLSLVVGVAGRDEQEVRQPIDIAKSASADRLALPGGERHHEALGPARDGAGKMQEARGRRPARQHEGAQGLKLAGEGGELALH